MFWLELFNACIKAFLLLRGRGISLARMHDMNMIILGLEVPFFNLLAWQVQKITVFHPREGCPS